MPPAILLLAALQAGAEEPTLTPEVQFRPRFELDTGRDFDADPVWFVTHRARLGATVSWRSWQTRIVLQDVRAWGEESDTRRDASADGLDLGIGTVTWRPHEHLALTLGRDEVTLHDERLVARAHWRQPGRRFDGARLTWEDGAWAAEAAGFLTVDGDAFSFDTQDQVEPDVGDQILAWARGGRQSESLVAQGVVVVDSRRDTPGRELLRVTPGVFLKAERGIARGRVEAYAQLGVQAGGTEQVRAGFLGLSGALAPPIALHPTFGLGYDLLTGDADPGDGRFTSFDTIRGANHRYYGHLDIAYALRGGEVLAEGLHDPHVKVTVSPTDHLTVALVQHLFAPAATAPGAQRWLALEPDLLVRYEAHPAVTVAAGASAWADLRGPLRPAELWAWLMLDVRYAGATRAPRAESR